MQQKWKSIGLLCVSQVLVMTLWFSGSMVASGQAQTFRLTALQYALLTSGVQVGFVVGTLVSATLGLADRLDQRRFFAASALIAASANLMLRYVSPVSVEAPLMRFITGACMAGVYPVGMKMASTWAQRDMGLIVGMLVGALTFGSASPHLLNALGGLDWRFTIVCSSALAAAGAALIAFFKPGPNHSKAPPFQPSLALTAWRMRPLRMANFGYFGHMWELYAMWTWVGVFLQDSFSRSMTGSGAALYARIATFLTIAAGAAGCLIAGRLADRVGRELIVIVALSISGTCSLTIGLFFGRNPVLLTVLCIVWGIAVVADSAQFSARIAELSDPSIVGTMLTVQTSVGFLITLITIFLTPYARDFFGWRYAFTFIAIGPAFGIWAMNSLRVSASHTAREVVETSSVSS
jgi:MFS family permease